MAVKGRFRATRAPYPRHSCKGWLRNWDIACNVALGGFLFAVGMVCVLLLLVMVTICAFCFKVSAGVRMKQDTHSATDDAIPLTTGVGKEWLNGSRFCSGWLDDFAAALSVCLIPS